MRQPVWSVWFVFQSKDDYGDPAIGARRREILTVFFDMLLVLAAMLVWLSFLRPLCSLSDRQGSRAASWLSLRPAGLSSVPAAGPATSSQRWAAESAAKLHPKLGAAGIEHTLTVEEPPADTIGGTQLR